jgi:branched-chain amino acid transport system ATP-binding protein
MDALLEVKNINCGYGSLQILWDVSLNVSEGEIVCILGPNGAGKTTLLNSIMNLLSIWDGTVSFQGNEITGVDTSNIARMGVGYVPEGKYLFEALSVYENLLLGAYTVSDQNEIKKRIERVYSLFPRLAERKKQASGTLSGGERQMLAIGRALMSEPTLLMLDEPSMGLSPKNTMLVMDAVATLHQEQGVSVLIVEQNVKAALDISNRGYIIEHGRISYSGEKKDILESKEIQEAYLGV